MKSSGTLGRCGPIPGPFRESSGMFNAVSRPNPSKSHRLPPGCGLTCIGYNPAQSICFFGIWARGASQFTVYKKGRFIRSHWSRDKDHHLNQLLAGGTIDAEFTATWCGGPGEFLAQSAMPLRVVIVGHQRVELWLLAVPSR